MRFYDSRLGSHAFGLRTAAGAMEGEGVRPLATKLRSGCRLRLADRPVEPELGMETRELERGRRGGGRSPLALSAASRARVASRPSSAERLRPRNVSRSFWNHGIAYPLPARISG